MPSFRFFNFNFNKPFFRSSSRIKSLKQETDSINTAGSWGINSLHSVIELGAVAEKQTFLLTAS